MVEIPHIKFTYLIDSAETRQVFNIDDYCYGLSYNNGSLICCTSGKGIKIFGMSHHNWTDMRILHNAPNKINETYVTSNEKGIFHSNWRDHSVICYDFSGQVQWKYSDLLLRTPCGITLDSYSNIYVAGYESNNIIAISPDGKQAKELLGASDGLLNPCAIYFDKIKNLLLVSNYKQVAFLFDVQSCKRFAT